MVGRRQVGILRRGETSLHVGRHCSVSGKGWGLNLPGEGWLVIGGLSHRTCKDISRGK